MENFPLREMGASPLVTTSLTMRATIPILCLILSVILPLGCAPFSKPPALTGETFYDRSPPTIALKQSSPGKLRFPIVTRREALLIAHAYHNHVWTATERNLFHGIDADGIRVDTPDSAFRPRGALPGYWVPGLVNRGIPYQWGGFSSLEEFDRGIVDGKFAGDIYTSDKRMKLYDAVSRHAVGVDCSGFVSRCWKLPRSFSTRELPTLCDELSSFNELLPGDIVNTHNNHVAMFSQWVDSSREYFFAFETGSPPTWKVQHHALGCKYLSEFGYKAYRYRNMR